MSAIITAVVVSAVGAGVGAYSSYESGQAAKALGNYNSTVGQMQANFNADRILQTADYNASVDDINAQSALKDSATAALNERFTGTRVLASQRARMAASGVVGDAGSPLKVQVSQAGFAEMAALETERQGRVRSQALMQESSVAKLNATNDAALTRWGGTSNATLSRMQGSAAAQAGTLNAGATLLQGAGKVGSMYYSAGKG